MVEVGTAVSVVEDTTRVVLESELVGLDSDGEDVAVQGGLHGRRRVSSHVGVALGLDGGGVGGIVFAGTVFGGVGIGSLGLSVVGLEVGDDLVGPATIAAVAAGVAVDVLLLGEGVELAVGIAPGDFSGAGTGE